MDILYEPNGTVHFAHGSNLYLLTKGFKGHVFMSCAHTYGCEASICLHENIIHQIKEHNHDVDEDDCKVMMMRFTKILRARAIEENGRVGDIYKDTVKLFPEGAQFMSVHNVKKEMGRARHYRPSVGHASFHNEPSGKIHCTFDSHVYRIVKKYTMFCFAKCVKASCPGRAVADMGKFRVSKPHNHTGSRRRVKRMLFLKSLKLRSATEKKLLLHIFDEESNKHPEGSKGTTFLSVKFQMSRARSIGYAEKLNVWYMPVDHSVFRKSSAKRSWNIKVGSQRLTKRILHTGPSATISPEFSQNINATNVTLDSGPVQIHWDKVPRPVLNTTNSTKESGALRAKFRKNLRRMGSELMEKVSCKTPKTVDPYSGNMKQSQILPPAQNLYFIMPPYYPPPVQQSDPIVSPAKNDPGGIKVEPPVVVETDNSLNLSDIKIEIKEEILDYDYNPTVIDLSSESDCEESIKQEIISNEEMVESPSNLSYTAEIKFSPPAVTEIALEPTEPPKLLENSETCKINISVNMEVDEPIIIEPDNNLESTRLQEVTNATISPIKIQLGVPDISKQSRAVSPITILENTDANASTQTDSPSQGEGREEISRTHSDIVTETLMEMHKILKNLRSERNSSNEVFGKYVATSMGCMTKRNAQAARREILEVLDKYET